MRILFWSDWFLPHIGGVETFSGRLLPTLAERGHQITVVAGHHRVGFPDVVDFGGVTVRRFPFHPILAANSAAATLDAVAKVSSLKRELAPDLIHLNTLGPSVLFHLASTARNAAPLLLTMHSPVMDDASRLDTLYGQALNSATFVNCNSEAVRRDLCRRLPAMEDRSSVTYYGMDAPKLRPSPRPIRDPRVLTYGRLVRDKGFDVAIRAFAVVRRSVPDARLVIAGDGEERGELERLAERCGIGHAVEFAGPIAPEEVPALVDTSSLVLVPSRWEEPFGLIALEAALMARPVVASRAGGLVEVVEDGTTGIVVEKEDEAAMAEAAIHLLKNPAIADRMGAAARERAQERFGWSRCVDEYERLYERTRDLWVKSRAN